MKKFLVAVGVVLGVNVAQAQVDSKVAYVVNSGGSHSLYIANDNLSNPILIRKSSKNVQILQPDFAPGGGRIAYAEGGVLKVTSYSGSSVGATTSIDSNGCEDPAFSPDGNKIAYTKFVGYDRVLMVADLVANSLTAYPVDYYGASTWHSANEIAYRVGRYDSSGTWNEIHLLDVSSNTDTVVFSTTDQIRKVDSFRGSNALLISLVNSSNVAQVKKLDLVSSALTFIINGSEGALNSDDSELYFKAASGRGEVIKRMNLISNSVQQLTPKAAEYRFLDARP